MIKINIRNFNFYTILSLLALIWGISFWIYWGTRYNVWDDIGIYSFCIVFIIPGIIGIILSLLDKKQEE